MKITILRLWSYSISCFLLFKYESYISCLRTIDIPANGAFDKLLLTKFIYFFLIPLSKKS